LATAERWFLPSPFRHMRTPRPWLGMDANAFGSWGQRGADRAGATEAVAVDIIEWHRLEVGNAASMPNGPTFLKRRPDWPGESYVAQTIRKDAVLLRSDKRGAGFLYVTRPPGPPMRLLAHVGRTGPR